jgi:hypothetical protein
MNMTPKQVLQTSAGSPDGEAHFKFLCRMADLNNLCFLCFLLCLSE